jgi:uncharacterized DUF497 family protein
VEFEWDERKRIATIEKHGLDFRDVMLVFEGKHIVMETDYSGERRQIVIGLIGPKFVAVVFTLRSGAVRIITARGARANERRAYRAIHN